MKTLKQRRNELQNKNKLERVFRKQAKAPKTIDLIANGITLVTPIAKDFAPILKFAEDTKLLDIASRYDLPITEQDELLLSEGDTYLEQYEKFELTAEEQVEMIENDWSPLVSSNLKAVKIDGNDLYIWFHNDMVYKYKGQAEMYYPFNEALSPGRLLWRTIRSKWSSKEVA